MSTNNYQLIVFDWDGTLIDSIEQIVTSLQAASESVVGEPVSKTAAKNVIGLGLNEAIERLHAGFESVQIEKIAAAYKQHYLYDNPVPAPLFEGVEAMLDELRSRDYQLAIATGKSRIGLDRSLKEHRLAHYFMTTRCVGESRSKPHPDMLLDILQTLEVDADQALMIGDSEHDLLMANNAQVDAIGVTHGVQGAEILSQYKPLVCLDRIADLSEFLTHN